jgi:hypothetical protein
MHTNYKKNNRHPNVVKQSNRLKLVGRHACMHACMHTNYKKEQSTKTGRPACTQITKKNKVPQLVGRHANEKKWKKKSTQTDDRRNGDRRRVDGSRVE